MLGVNDIRPNDVMPEQREAVKKDREWLPESRQYVHWLVPKHGYWTSGYYSVLQGQFGPGFFQGPGGAYHICDGYTWWTPELPMPANREEKNDES